MLVLNMESIFEKGNELEEEHRLILLNMNKMLAYLFSWFICYIDDEVFKDDKFLGKV